MYTIVFLTLMFLLAFSSALLYFHLKKSRQNSLNNGVCPRCGATAKKFRDENTGVDFEVEAIKTKVLKKHGCSGVNEMEYRCSSCDLKEVYAIESQRCGI